MISARPRVGATAAIETGLVRITAAVAASPVTRAAAVANAIFASGTTGVAAPLLGQTTDIVEAFLVALTARAAADGLARAAAAPRGVADQAAGAPAAVVVVATAIGAALPARTGRPARGNSLLASLLAPLPLLALLRLLLVLLLTARFRIEWGEVHTEGADGGRSEATDTPPREPLGERPRKTIEGMILHARNLPQ